MIENNSKKSEELTPRKALKKANVLDTRIHKNLRELKSLELQIQKKEEAIEQMKRAYRIYIRMAINDASSSVLKPSNPVPEKDTK